MKINYLKELYEDFDGVVCLFDDNDNIIYVNKLFSSLLGYDENELVGSKIIDLIVPDEKSAFLDMYYFGNQKKDSTVKLYHKTGAYRYFSVKIYNLNKYNQMIGYLIKRTYQSYDYDGESIIDKLYENLNNIDADNLSEIIIKDSQDLRLVLDYLPIDIWIKDKYHRYIFANRTLAEHTSIPREDFYLKDDFDLFDNHIANEFLSSDQSAMDQKEKISYIFEAKSKKLLSWTEVTKIPVYNKNSDYIGMIGFAVDLSEIKRVERSLESKNARLEFILKNVQGVIFEIAKSGDLIFSSGPLVKELAVYKKGINILDHFSKHEEHKELVDKLKQAMDGEKTKLVTTINNIKVEISFNPKYDTENNLSILGYANKVEKWYYDKPRNHW